MKYYLLYVYVYIDLEILNMKKKDIRYFFNMQLLDIYVLVLRNIFMVCVKKVLLMKKFIEIYVNIYVNIENEINCEIRL